MRRKHSLLGIFTATVMGLAMMPSASIVSFAADQFEQGTDAEGYDWELWNQNGQGSASMTHPGNGTYSCEWSNIENVLFRAGKRFGFNATKTWKEYDNIAINYDVDYQPSGNSYLCCYGWTMNPTVEYYIVEDWGNWRPPGTELQGSIEIDGVTYDLYTSMRVNKPSIFSDNDTFPQYWSVRREDQKSSKGTIRVSDHFAAWEKIGWDMKGALYEVALNVEGYQSSGKANVKKNEIIFGADPIPVPETPDTPETPEVPEDGIYFQSGFEDGTDGWSGRGDAKAAQDSTAYAGEKGFAVTGRTDTWNGASTKLDTKTFVPGNSYSFSVMAMQNAAASDAFKLTLQYTDANGKEQYDTVAEGTGKQGEWVQLANTNYQIPAGASGLLLYVETSDSKNDFFIDEACAGVKGTEFTAEPAEQKPLLGDVDLNGKVELKDLVTLQKYMLGFKATVDAVTADMNADGTVDVFDLALLKRELLKKNSEPVDITPAPTEKTEEPEAPTAETPERREGYWYNTADVSWIDPSKPMVAFAFDDGPNYADKAAFATRIQNALSENKAHGTFFYVGQNIAGNEAEIKRAQELGFEIANHTWTHTDLRGLDAAAIREEVESCAKKLTEVTGQTDFLLRPPYLGVNDTVKSTVNVPLINCGLDSGDWDGASAQEMIDKFTAAAANGSLNGKVILMHETYDSTAQAVEYLVPYLQGQGWQIVSVSEMFKAKGVDMKNGEVYNGLP